MALGGSYEKALIQEESGWDDDAFRKRVDCIPIPAAPGGQQATVAGGMVYVVFRQSKDAALSLEVLKSVVSPSSMQEFCARTGRSPTRMSVVNTLDPDKSWFSHRVSRFLHSARARSDIPEYAGVSEQFQLMIENAILRRMSPGQAVEKAREIIGILVSKRAAK